MPRMIANRVIRPKVAPTVKKILECKPAMWSKKCRGTNGRPDVVEAWFKGQDFHSPFTSYFSVRNSLQLKGEGYTHILILDAEGNREVPLV